MLEREYCRRLVSAVTVSISTYNSTSQIWLAPCMGEEVFCDTAVSRNRRLWLQGLL